MVKTLQVALAALALGAAAFGSTTASAGPITLYSSFDGVTFTVISAASTTGTNSFNSSVGSFGVQFSATGTGSGPSSLPQPAFDTNTITVSSSAGGTIYLAALETGLTNTNVGFFNLGFTNNALSTTSVMESFFVGTSLSLASVPLATVTLAPNGATPLLVTAPVLTSPYQIAEMYKINFGTSGGSVNATIAERAVVPEPISISLLGAGLAVAGLIRMRRKA